MGWGAAPPGGSNFGRVAKGGAKNFVQAVKGAKNFGLGHFFSMFLKHSFFMFCGYFGHF